ncbi:MAG: response regulator [Proteobacteria bacterium]|nr:response regulator [Pseudomonadota bacterium]
MEDNIAIRCDAADKLRAEGFAVVETPTADAALLMLKSGWLPNVLITDVRMPGQIDGNQLVRTCRQLWPALRTIVVSGEPATGISPSLEDLRFLKPVDWREIAMTARKMLTLWE